MKTKILIAILLVLSLVGCNLPIHKSEMTSTPEPTALSVSPEQTASVIETSLPSFSIDWSKSFSHLTTLNGEITLNRWTSDLYEGIDIPLPVALQQVYNSDVLDGLTEDQKDLLSKNGFLVIHSQEEQFADIREETAQQTGQPYFLTTDAAFHALHLQFDELLKALEKEYFRPQLISITQAVLQELQSELPEVRGGGIEKEASQALAFISVGLKLLDPQAVIDPSVSEIVAAQVNQIEEAAGWDQSKLFPEFKDDYSAYIPVGHYTGDAELEAYFKAMTWFGRVHFQLQDPENPAFVPSRVPLIVTQALRKAQGQEKSAVEDWSELHQVLTFMIGPSDDPGPLEYSTLMDQVYKDQTTLINLGRDDLWQEFLSRAGELPAPQINSLLITTTIDLSTEKGWRFMGQRFTLDGMILQNLIYDLVKEKPDGTQRELPSGLDVMAVLGSQPAYAELEAEGATSFPNYPDQFEKMQKAVSEQSEDQWLGRFYDGWLYSFLPLLQAKENAYPAYMRSPAWNYKEMNTGLGSWAELKHDTILYTKMPEGMGGGGPPRSNASPSYVEANPQVFYRMAYMAKTLAAGLDTLYFDGTLDQEGYIGQPNAAGFLTGMSELGMRFEKLGAIAAKELSGQPLDEEDNALLTRCLGMVECLNLKTPSNQPNSEMPKVPVVAAVAGAKNNVLEAAVGKVDRMFVIVPLEDHWEVAQGGVFSYYEFPQPREQRLTDDAWRETLSEAKISLPEWSKVYNLPGGQSTKTIFFRVGDVYWINEAGDQLKVHENPSLGSPVTILLKTDDYITLVDGPVQADGYTWWKVQLFTFLENDPASTGWIVENPEWIERSY